jgi:transcriptional antiterminator
MQALTWEQICKRAGGRRKYNRYRQANAFWRRLEIDLYLQCYGYEPGILAELARYYQVHRSTITRDVQRILKGRPMPKSRAERELTREAHAIVDRRLRRKGVRTTNTPMPPIKSVTEEQIAALIEAGAL